MVFQELLISDGAYDVTYLPFVYLKQKYNLYDKIGKDGLEFVMKHKPINIYIASGYDVPGIFLFAGKPKQIDFKGTFGRGACAMFENCPKSILLVASSD